jgi:hypothetical protein
MRVSRSELDAVGHSTGGSLIEGMFVFNLVPKVSRFLLRTNRVSNNNFSSAAVATVARTLEKQLFLHLLRGIAVL